MAEGCIFCKIRDGVIESDILYRDDKCFVIRDIAPKAPVHLLVIPVQHFNQLANMTSSDHEMIAGLYQAAQEMARQEGVDSTGYRLIVNQGANSGQVVPHLHLHLMGGRQLREMG